MNMSTQETFNKIARHLLTQNSKSQILVEERTLKYICKLKLNNGKSCAIGCLFPDGMKVDYLEGIELYHEEITYSKVGKLLCEARVKNLWELLYELGYDAHNPRFHIMLSMMQYIHDTKMVAEWPAQINKAAKYLKLKNPLILADQ